MVDKMVSFWPTNCAYDPNERYYPLLQLGKLLSISEQQFGGCTRPLFRRSSFGVPHAQLPLKIATQRVNRCLTRGISPSPVPQRPAVWVPFETPRSVYVSGELYHKDLSIV